MSQNPRSLPEGLAKSINPNRRAHVRYRCTRPIPRRMALAESFASLEGWLVDISAAGLGLLLDRPLELGTMLFIELESTPEAIPLDLLANVTRATQTENGEWLIGCELVNRLEEDELKALLL